MAQHGLGCAIVGAFMVAAPGLGHAQSGAHDEGERLAIAAHRTCNAMRDGIAPEAAVADLQVLAAPADDIAAAAGGVSGSAYAIRSMNGAAFAVKAPDDSCAVVYAKDLNDEWARKAASDALMSLGKSALSSAAIKLMNGESAQQPVSAPTQSGALPSATSATSAVGDAASSAAKVAAAAAPAAVGVSAAQAAAAPGATAAGVSATTGPVLSALGKLVGGSMSGSAAPAATAPAASASMAGTMASASAAPAAVAPAGSLSAASTFATSFAPVSAMRAIIDVCNAGLRAGDLSAAAQRLGLAAQTPPANYQLPNASEGAAAFRVPSRDGEVWLYTKPDDPKSCHLAVAMGPQATGSLIADLLGKEGMSKGESGAMDGGSSYQQLTAGDGKVWANVVSFAPPADGSAASPLRAYVQVGAH